MVLIAEKTPFTPSSALYLLLIEGPGCMDSPKSCHPPASTLLQLTRVLTVVMSQGRQNRVLGFNNT